MVFNDKKQSDFTLFVSINWNAQYVRTWKKIFGPGGWRASNDGLSVNFGTTNLAFTAASASLDGAVIKLG